MFTHPLTSHILALLFAFKTNFPPTIFHIHPAPILLSTFVLHTLLKMFTHPLNSHILAPLLLSKLNPLISFENHIHFVPHFYFPPFFLPSYCLLFLFYQIFYLSSPIHKNSDFLVPTWLFKLILSLFRIPHSFYPLFNFNISSCCFPHLFCHLFD